jgi:hypothetical protein
MGNRFMKSLSLNGIVVGDYLASDDFDEDVQAARDMLKAKGLYDPPTLVMAMRGQADQFAFVANATYVQVMKNRGPGQIIPASPFVVNAAFSLELYLKTLNAVSGSKAWGHGLLKLHDSLPDPIKAELQADTVRLASEHGEGPTVQLRDLLAMLNRSFEQWRYVYELPKSGAIHFQQTILAMHACREVCNRAVAAALQPVTP